MNDYADQQIKNAIVGAAHSGLEVALLLLEVRNNGSFDGAISTLKDFIESESKRIRISETDTK